MGWEGRCHPLGLVHLGAGDGVAATHLGAGDGMAATQGRTWGLMGSV